MKKVVILGGGVAGLSAAVFITKSKIPVILLESSNRPGGRASSFYDPVFKSVIDNGQHIMLGCYFNTLRYLDIIKARGNFCFQNELEVNFFKDGNISPLKAGRGMFPVGLINGLLSFKLLKLKERFELLKFFVMLPLSSKRDLEKKSAEEWLIEAGQGSNVRDTFWNTFILGTLNTTAKKASALLLRSVLMQVFFTGKNSSIIVIPDKPLSESFGFPAISYLEQNNSETSFSERVVKLETDKRKKKVSAIVTTKRTITDFSYVVSSLPLFSLKKIVHLNELKEFNPIYSPIITVHFRTKSDLFKERFMAIVGSPIQWIFKQEKHYTIVISNAAEFIPLENEQIKILICGELVKLFKVPASEFNSLRIIKEKKATFVPSPDVLGKRQGHISSLSNLLYAGDWTETGLPATIEGAVTSGLKAANEIITLTHSR